MKLRRAGQREATQPPAARPPIDVSMRRPAAPGRFAGIRGLPAVADERLQTEAAWREVWRDELAARGER